MAPSTASLVDLYEITQLQAARESGAASRASVFELFARRLPAGRAYGVVGGVARAVEAVRNFRFTDEQLSHIAAHPGITRATVAYLEDYKFEGDLLGYSEGELYFPYSPIMRVEGTFADAVLLETVLLSILNHDSAVASAASRMVAAAQGRFPIIEMGSRRTHELAAVDSARAAYVAGFASTSNVEASLRHGVPMAGTSAHAFTLLHDTEEEAFAAQVQALGVGTTLLVDTYGIEEGIRRAVRVAGPELGGIRIDSGDLGEETRKARALLDSLGAHSTKIVVSSDIDEYSIAALVASGAPVDAVGAGTRVVTGSGHPTAGMVFKLVARENSAGEMVSVAKRATGKGSVGGRKLPYRTFKGGKIEGEFYSTTHLPDLPEGPLQRYLLSGGEPLPLGTAADARDLHARRLQQLPEEALSLTALEAQFTVAEAPLLAPQG